MKRLSHPTEAQIDEFIREFASSNERVLVIAVVSQIDACLTKLLGTRLLASRKKKDDSDELFAADRPLGSFSAKINLTYRLSLIDPSLADVLHCLRKVRNEYAHLVFPGNLGSGEQAKALRKAHAIFREEGLEWWGVSPESDIMLFRYISMHVLIKLVIAIEPNRKPELPIPLKASEAEAAFFDLLAGKSLRQ